MPVEWVNAVTAGLQDFPLPPHMDIDDFSPRNDLSNVGGELRGSPIGMKGRPCWPFET